jgi:hypothetical protein
MFGAYIKLCVQLLERVNEEKVELVEEAPLQAVSVSHVHAAPTQRVTDDQVEELLEENRRLMDEVRFGVKVRVSVKSKGLG